MFSNDIQFLNLLFFFSCKYLIPIPWKDYQNYSESTVDLKNKKFICSFAELFVYMAHLDCVGGTSEWMFEEERERYYKN